MDELMSQKYKMMLDITIELSEIQNIRDVLSIIVNRTTELLLCDRCTLYLITDSGDELVSEFIAGGQIKQIKIPLTSNSIAGYCALYKKIINIKDVYDNISKYYKGIQFNPYFDKRNNYRTKTILAAPLFNKDGKILGVIEAINKLPDNAGFDTADENLIEILAKQASVTVTRLKMQELATFFTKEEQKLLKGEQNVFVVYFDITNYTGLSEILGNSAIKRIIQLWETDHIHLINKFGGVYVKSVGDEIMSVFGLESAESSKTQYLGRKIDENLSISEQFEIFIAEKQKLSNLDNLFPLIQNFIKWRNVNSKKIEKRMNYKIRRFLDNLLAENVIRFMYLAQKKFDWLNKIFIREKLIGSANKDRIYMKGGSEYGSVIVDFDMYGRIDVTGDIVNVASRITSEGGRLAIVTATDEHPIIIGQNFYDLISSESFVNITKNIAKFKGKEKNQYIYVVDSINTFENIIGLTEHEFSEYRKYVEKIIKELENVKQGFLPFNYASYKIEMKDKYKNDHSKRVAVHALHIINLINSNIQDKINYEEKRILYYKKLIKKLKIRIDSITLKIENPEKNEKDISADVFSKPFDKLSPAEQLNFLFDLSSLKLWEKNNKSILKSDTELYENFIEELNLFKNVSFPGKTKKQVLTEALYQKKDILNDSENNIEYKNGLIRDYKQKIILDHVKRKIAIASLLHDLGNKCLSDQIKSYDEPTKSIKLLSNEEREEYSAITTSFGAAVIASIDELADIAPIVKWHQAHYNGVYNHKKLNQNNDIPKFEDIPVESRILFVANAIDAILSDKPSRERLGILDLCKIFADDLKNQKNNVEKKFDPYIISLILNYFDYKFSDDLLPG
ncbi:GAF domain-containing protein [Candidatus Dependentiae bacterium]|nr:GAF domain-containing protein [Candidatus Dependentiae bacterium]